MLIGLNLLAVRSDHPVGVERYVRNVVGHMRLSLGSQLTIALRRLVKKDYALGSVFFVNNPAAQVRRYSVGGTAVRVILEMLWLPFVFFRCDRVLSINNFGPLFGKPSQRRTVVIHDVWFLSKHYDGGVVARLAFRALIKIQLWTTHQVVTISHFSKREIVEKFGVPPECIAVIPLCLEREVILGSVGDLVKANNMNSDYFLLIGADRKNKNVLRAMEGYAAYVANVDKPMELVLVGRYTPSYMDMLRHRFAALVGQTVHLKGYVSRNELLKLIRGAKGIVFPSLYEGYGIPVVESLVAGKPVLLSRGTVCEENAGLMGVAVDGRDVDDLAQGYQRLSVFDVAATSVGIEVIRGRIFDCETPAQKLCEVLQ